MKPNLLIPILILVLLAASCAPLTETPTPAPIIPPIVTQEQPVLNTAVVESVEVQVMENSPLQVNVIVRGQLPDAGCTTLLSASQTRDGNTFHLTLMTATDPLAVCVLVLTPFEQVVSLDVSNLPPATYVVNANGVESTFELLTRDLGQFKQILVDALNARNYELLKTLMGESLMIAYWRSEGTSNTPDQAIEQLRLNLLNSSSPITADYTKNLIELLGTDPVKIVGPDVIEASPLFVSGLGAAGRDEAIIFTAKLPDGTLYWYGLLFAKDGFVTKPAPTIVVPPVDTNAYPTNVKFVLARQDVRMRNGPGTQFNVISWIAAGQTAKVTGVNANGSWWRVICPDDRIGSCWVSADPKLTRPTDGPLPDTTVYPTNVQYVMAQKDVKIHGGPGTQFNVIGMVAEGQTAKVTGTNFNGSWWRVICPDNSIGSCWVSADPKLTRPSDPPGDQTGKADVQSVEIQVLESYPLQVNVIARGWLPDAGCTSIAGVTQTRNGNVFTVTVKTKIDPLALCAQMLTPFEQVIPLEVDSLMPGTYIVRVNGVEASFVLP